MAESSAMNSRDKMVQLVSKEDEKEGIKEEIDVPVSLVKPEPRECVVCVTRSQECFDIHSTNTTASGISLHAFLSKFTNSELPFSPDFVKYICKTCLDLVNILEQAEIEYKKLKETFEAIISKNPLFYLHQPIRLENVKNEIVQDNDNYGLYQDLNDDSENEPLVVIKKKRGPKAGKRKKVSGAVGKRKVQSKPKHDDSDNWECRSCGAAGAGGPLAHAAHQLAAHTILRDIKKEDSNDGELSNGFDDSMLKLEPDDDLDNDTDSDFLPDEELSDDNKPRRKVGGRRHRDKGSADKKTKVLHQCDQCNAKYTSLVRLEQHKQKHDGSKPPYICEVCGAHYKHKRACDIHIAMHKGISDWKCEECNKLFPSKGALQRHNNIHTGKLNYQCDLCGKSFIHTSSFKMHKLSHSGVKPHACDVCGLALMTRSHLKRHKRVHSGEKRHECNICGRRFSERYNLLAHSKSHEGGAPNSPATEVPRRRLFRCPFCAERFERRYMLERHAAATHGRALERPPPTPRNTMSKLLKAQAARPAARADVTADGDSKAVRSPDSEAPSVPPQKLVAHLSSSSSLPGGASWSSAYQEFNLRAEFH